MRHGAVLAFNVLPTIIFFASLMSVLYHVGLMQRVVRAIAWVMQRTLKTSGAETIAAAGEIFLGPVESSLLIKPFLRDFTRSELFAVMVTGLATAAGGVLAAYIGMLSGLLPDIAGHLHAASVMNVPAGLSLRGMLGQLLRPVAWVLGVPWQDTVYVGGLIGIKATLNDFVAYSQFARDLAAGIVLAPRSALILTYGLVGFANFGSIAIQIGGIGGMVPERRGEIARFGLRAMIAGNLAAFTSAAIAGMLL